MMTTPINEINEDYLRLKADYRRKLSDRTLLYMKFKGLITKAQLDVYQAAQEKPEDREIISFVNTVLDTNQKFLEFYDTV